MTGEALDHKTPLLRSQQAMAAQAERVLRLFGHEKPDAVVSFAGAEQEYFLIDRSFFLSRPDLLNAGRTLFGAKPPKGQEFDDHYFGAIPERVLGFMLDAERELFKLGIRPRPGTTRSHPASSSWRPMFERSNVAADHQQLLMVTLKTRRPEARHGVPLPREAVRGDQRLGQARQLLARQLDRGQPALPGDTPHDNAQFLVFCGAVIRAVHKFGGLLRASVASATNDHRLGANEAPPAIISIFLGDQLTDVFDQIAKGGATNSKEKGTLEIGVDTLPVLPTDPGDRNRTSPFAFTGNRFEFRAPGSLQSIAGPMVTINTILAEALDYIATELEALVADGTEFKPPCRRSSKRSSPSTARWSSTATATPRLAGRGGRRGLPNLRTTLDALPAAHHRGGHGPLQQVRRVQPPGDAQPLRDRPRAVHPQHRRRGPADPRDRQHLVLPAAIRYQTELATNLASLKAVGAEGDTTSLDEVSAAIAGLRAGIAKLCAENELGQRRARAEEEAKHAQEELMPAMAPCGRRPTCSKASSPTTSGRWPPTRRCSTSSSRRSSSRRFESSAQSRGSLDPKRRRVSRGFRWPAPGRLRRICGASAAGSATRSTIWTVARISVSPSGVPRTVQILVSERSTTLTPETAPSPVAMPWRSCSSNGVPRTISARSTQTCHVHSALTSEFGPGDGDAPAARGHR